jgi:hypothetical protein
MEWATLMSLLQEPYLYVGLIGMLVGITELLSRYRDSPWKALLNAPAAIYVLVNISASLLALLLIEVFKWSFTDDPTASKEQWVRVLVAGVGAMSFFRSSLFTFRVGDKDVPLGPGLIFQVLLDVTDRAVDRARAKPRSLAVARIMSGVSFPKAQAALPAYCFALMQNVTADEQAAFGKQVAQLSATTTMTDTVKSLALGPALINLVGDAVLLAAVESLKDEIR